MHALEERVARLEKANRRWRMFAFVTAAMALIACMFVPTVLHEFVWSRIRFKSDLDRTYPAEVVRAKRLEIVDDAGTVVAKIANGSLGGAELNVLGANGKQRAVLFATDKGGFLRLLGDEDTTNLAAGSLILHKAVNLENVDDADAQLDMVMKATHVELGIANVVGGFAKLSGPTGNTALRLGSFESGGGYVQVLNPAGKIVAEMQCSKANAGLIGVKDFDGNVKEGLSGSK